MSEFGGKMIQGSRWGLAWQFEYRESVGANRKAL